MPYQTGTATSPTNLLQTLVTFLTSNGWTSDKSSADGAGWRSHLHLGSQFVHMRAFAAEGAPTVFAAMGGSAQFGIALYASTSFNGSVAWNVQPGSPPFQSGSSTNVVGVGMNLPSGSIQNYYFFCDGSGDNVVVVVEKTPGVYVHMGWGSSIAKAGSFTGGQYFFGCSNGWNIGSSISTNPSEGFVTTSDCPGTHPGDYASLQAMYIRADVDSFTGKWIGVSDSTSITQGYTGKNAASLVFIQTARSGGATAHTEIPMYASLQSSSLTFQSKQTSELDGRSNLLPVMIWAARDVSGYSPLGTLPNIFYTNGTFNGFSNASVYSIGSTNYMMFPNFAVVKQ